MALENFANHWRDACFSPYRDLWRWHTNCSSLVEEAPAAETYKSLLKDHREGRRYGHLIDGVSIRELQPEQAGSERIQSWQSGRKCPDNQFLQVG